MRIPQLMAAAAVGALALAACGSGGSYSSPSSPSASQMQVATATRAAVRTTRTALGDVLVDASGMTLYGRTADTNGMPSCVGACATAWPPLTVDTATLPAGVDAKLFSVVTRPDGSQQLKAGNWPLYRYAGDAASGDTNGQGSGGVWFVVTPTGALHKS